MIRYATLIEAQKAVTRWGGDPLSVTHIGDRGNSVYSFRNAQGHLQILRFTDPHFRSREELAAEIEFVDGLHEAGVSVARSIPTLDGTSLFLAGSLLCSSIAYAPGTEINDGSSEWGKEFFRAWGRNLAEIHNHAASLTQPLDRWQWNQELLIARADELIPRDDLRAREEFHEVMALCRALPKSSATFGLIHADHAPQNFRYAEGKITAFDFGNCCYHWFVADLAISLSTVRRKENREKIRENILAGYEGFRPLPSNLDEQIELFIRLRVLYVYLSRLHLWSENRTAEQERDLKLFQASVYARKGW